MAIKIYNTITRKKEPLQPLEDNHVKLYVCGITSYDYCHIGHARSALVFDMVVRYLRYRAAGWPSPVSRGHPACRSRLAEARVGHRSGQPPSGNHPFRGCCSADPVGRIQSSQENQAKELNRHYLSIPSRVVPRLVPHR